MIKPVKIFSLVLNSVDFDSRVKKTAATLRQFGEVEVVGLRSNRNPAGVVCTGGYNIRREVLYDPDGGSRLGKRVRQIVAYLMYSIDAAIRIRGGTVVVCNDVSTLPIGIMARVFHPSLKVVYDSHEYQAHARWVGAAKRVGIRLLERICLPFTAEVVVVSGAISDAYSRDYAIKVPRVVMNCPPFVQIKPGGKLRSLVGGPSTQIILYQGGLTNGRGLELMIQAFSRVSNENARLVFMGYGPLETLILEASKFDRRIVMVPPVPPEEVLEYTADADFGLCVLPDDCLNHRYCLPNKLFEYLMAGVPILANDLVEVRKIIDEGKAGVIASLTSVEEAKAAIDRALCFDRTEFDESLEALRRKYCWARQALVWEDIFVRLGFDKISEAVHCEG